MTGTELRLLTMVRDAPGITGRRDVASDTVGQFIDIRQTFNDWYTPREWATTMRSLVELGYVTVVGFTVAVTQEGWDISWERQPRRRTWAP